MIKKTADPSEESNLEELFDESAPEDVAAEEAQIPREKTFEGPGGASWKAAGEIVEKVKPVPWLLWVVIRSVYGRAGVLGEPDPQSFSVVTNLLIYAANDRTLSHSRGEDGDGKVTSLHEAVEMVGADVAGSLCFIHAVCRRVSNVLNERVWRPIIDDALLRAHIGYHVGQIAPEFGAGRGMLAGFAGRCGLAIQIASGSMEEAQKALAGLASGADIGQVCQEIYGCDPLKVAALSLIAGGANRDIAMGIAAFSSEEQVDVGTEQYRWLTLFEVIEHVRMGRQDQISEQAWLTLGYDPAAKNDLLTRVQLVQRKGHGWRWITQSLAEKSGKTKRKK